MSGPPPKLATQRQRTNTPQLSVVKREDEEPSLVPEAPAGLLKSSKDRWLAYWGSVVAGAADPTVDMHRVIRWVRAIDEYERAFREFKKERVTTGSTGQLVIHPLAGYLKDCQAEIAKAETELGMTPMARLRLGIATGQAKLTAMELSKRLKSQAEPVLTDPASEVWEAEWTEA